MKLAAEKLGLGREAAFGVNCQSPIIYAVPITRSE